MNHLYNNRITIIALLISLSTFFLPTFETISWALGTCVGLLIGFDMRNILSDNE